MNWPLPNLLCHLTNKSLTNRNKLKRHNMNIPKIAPVSLVVAGPAGNHVTNFATGAVSMANLNPSDNWLGNFY